MGGESRVQIPTDGGCWASSSKESACEQGDPRQKSLCGGGRDGQCVGVRAVGVGADVLGACFLKR